MIKQPLHGVAHVETNQQTTCLVWRRQQLYDCMDSSPEVASALRAAITSDVVRKHCDPEREGEQAQLRELWLARYGSILRAVLEEGEARAYNPERTPPDLESLRSLHLIACAPLDYPPSFTPRQVTAAQREQLLQFRSEHTISPSEHERLLRECGWSGREYERGQSAPSKVRLARHITKQICGSLIGDEELPSAIADSGEGSGSGAFLRWKSHGISDVVNEKPLCLWDARTTEVAALQQRLNLFFNTKALEVDGHFGPVTQQAVELFQGQMGLRVDGTVDKATWKVGCVLDALPAPSTSLAASSPPLPSPFMLTQMNPARTFFFIPLLAPSPNFYVGIVAIANSLTTNAFRSCARRTATNSKQTICCQWYAAMIRSPSKGVLRWPCCKAGYRRFSVPTVSLPMVSTVHALATPSANF